MENTYALKMFFMDGSEIIGPPRRQIHLPGIWKPKVFNNYCKLNLLFNFIDSFYIILYGRAFWRPPWTLCFFLSEIKWRLPRVTFESELFPEFLCSLCKQESLTRQFANEFHWIWVLFLQIPNDWLSNLGNPFYFLIQKVLPSCLRRTNLTDKKAKYIIYYTEQCIYLHKFNLCHIVFRSHEKNSNLDRIQTTDFQISSLMLM